MCCRVMKVSISGFYAWKACPVSDRDWNDAILTNAIVDIHRRTQRSDHIARQRYHDESAPRGRNHRIVVAVHPSAKEH